MGAEANIYFPFIREKCDELPSKLAKDHEQLLQNLDNIRDLEQEFNVDDEEKKEEDFIETLQELNTLCSQLRDDMNQHLKEEEKNIPPLMKKYGIKESEERKVIDKIIQDLGLSGNKVMLPWILDVMQKWGGSKVVNNFKSDIPAPIIFLNYFYWTEEYQKNNVGAITKLLSE